MNMITSSYTLIAICIVIRLCSSGSPVWYQYVSPYYALNLVCLPVAQVFDNSLDMILIRYSDGQNTVDRKTPEGKEDDFEIVE
jgi:hypothetical protein